jgi:hypothetical protein
VPVYGVPQADILSRARYYRQRIEDTVSSAALRDVGLVYHDHIHDILAHVYFAISQAYKKTCLKSGNRTDAWKRAAITCASITAVQPLRPPLIVNDLEREEYLYANPILAMRCACPIVEHQFEKRPFDDQRRQYKSILGMQFPCIEPILVEARKSNGIIENEYDVMLTTDEEAKINSLIEHFMLFSYMRIPNFRRDE